MRAKQHAIPYVMTYIVKLDISKIPKILDITYGIACCIALSGYIELILVNNSQNEFRSSTSNLMSKAIWK